MIVDLQTAKNDPLDNAVLVAAGKPSTPLRDSSGEFFLGPLINEAIRDFNFRKLDWADIDPVWIQWRRRYHRGDRRATDCVFHRSTGLRPQQQISCETGGMLQIAVIGVMAIDPPHQP